MGICGSADSDHLWHHVPAHHRIPAAWPSIAGGPDALAADRAGVDHRQPDSTASVDGSVLRPIGALRFGAFPLLFIGAYRLPGGVAAVINSLSPLLVVVISVPLLGARIRSIQIIAGILGAAGVALLVLRSDARLDVVGLIAMAGVAIMFGVATVLTKRWGEPEGMTAIGVTGWIFLFAGLTLLPVTLLIEGLPDHLTARNIGGLIYLVLISGILAYAVWFWGLQRLSASAVTFLTLLNPVTAALLGWVVLDQRLNAWQLLGAVIILISVVLGQPGTFDRRRQRRSALASRV
jgi:probable blue pigment (indigoidine) exporter